MQRRFFNSTNHGVDKSASNNGIESNDLKLNHPVAICQNSNIDNISNDATPDDISDDSPVSASHTITERDVLAVKSRILSQLNGGVTHIEDSNIFHGYEIVRNILEKTVTQGERHSLLLVGPRSSGKSTIVKKSLKYLTEKYPQDFLAIHLNSVIHSDDSAAVREIARQLDLTTRRNIENKGAHFTASQLETTIERKSIHETFSNILNVLNISLENVEDSGTKHTPLVFIIDEFEKFTSNYKQTLLYNLLDMSQNSDVPITVIGLTTKINARDNMEKRVNSRFSQRILTILPTVKFADYVENVMSGLLVSEAFSESLDASPYGREWNGSIKRMFQDGKNSDIHMLCMRNFNTTKNYREIHNIFKVLLSEISTDNPYFDNSRLSDVIQKCTLIGNLQSAVCSLSDSELLILVAAAKWIEKFESPTVNFNLAFCEYISLMKESDSVANASFSINNMKVNKKHWSKKALRNSWEVLFKCNLLVEPLSTLSTQSASTERRAIKTVVIDDNTMVLLDITLDELNVLVGDSRLAKKLLRL